LASFPSSLFWLLGDVDPRLPSLKFHNISTIVHERLEDDGIFYLQIAGLRRHWQFEDLIWGLFMNKYIFPGADASCPLGWYVSQLETVRFFPHLFFS